MQVMSEKSGSPMRKVFDAVVLLLAVAVCVRIAATLLDPLIPTLAVLVVLGVIYAIALGGWRR